MQMDIRIVFFDPIRDDEYEKRRYDRAVADLAKNGKISKENSRANFQDKKIVEKNDEHCAIIHWEFSFLPRINERINIDLLSSDLQWSDNKQLFANHKYSNQYYPNWYVIDVSYQQIAGIIIPCLILVNEFFEQIRDNLITGAFYYNDEQYYKRID